MTDPSDSRRPNERSSGTGPRLRAAAIGLVAIAVLIAAVILFGNDDEDDSNGSSNESSSGSATTTTSQAPVTTETTTAPAPTATGAPSESAEPTATTTVGEEPEQSSTPAAPGSTDSAEGQTDPPPPASAIALITSYGWNEQNQSIEVVGAVQGVTTQSSTCTATAVMGASSQQATVPGTFDGQGTSCGLIAIPMDGMPQGTYQVAITFDAGNGVVTSNPVDVAVP